METEQNDKAEVTPVQLWIAISVPVFLFSFVLIVMGLIFPFRFVFLLCVGWASYLVRTLSRLTISPSQTLMFLSTLLLFAVGFHLYCRRIKRRLSADPVEVIPWQRRWSLSLVSMFLLLAVSGICVISVTHQFFWRRHKTRSLKSYIWEAQAKPPGGVRPKIISSRLVWRCTIIMICIASFPLEEPSTMQVSRNTAGPRSCYHIWIIKPCMSR